MLKFCIDEIKKTGPEIPDEKKQNRTKKKEIIITEKSIYIFLKWNKKKELF